MTPLLSPLSLQVMAASRSQTLHWTQTISNTTWGHQLSFHPFSRGDAPVRFSSLWPDKEILVATYKEANLVQCVYDLCKLLVVTNSDRSLDALLENHVSQPVEFLFANSDLPPTPLIISVW